MAAAWAAGNDRSRSLSRRGLPARHSHHHRHEAAMTYALLLLTCSLSGGDCRPVLAADGLQQMECQVRAQQLAAQYIGDHPNRKFKAMKCVDHRRIDFYLGRNQA
jgi:hypothetical protein